MFAPMKCSRPWNVRAHTLTIWARQNLQLLTPSQSGWRALSQMVLPLLHAVLKWDLLSGRPAYIGGVSAVLYRLVVPARPAQIFASCPNICGREYFHLFPGNFRRSLGVDCSAPRTLIKELVKEKTVHFGLLFQMSPLGTSWAWPSRSCVEKGRGCRIYFHHFLGSKIYLGS